MLAVNCRKNLLFARVHARFLRVKFRVHDVGHILLFLQASRRLGLLDFRFRRFDGGFILRQLLPHAGGVKLNQHIALFDLGRVGHQAHDLQIARIVRPRDDLRAERFDLALDFEGIDKILTLHLRGRNCGR